MKKCLTDGCESKYHAKGYCMLHYKKLVRSGLLETKPISPDFCTIEGCDLPHKAKGLCNRHYKKLTRDRPFENYALMDGHSKHELYGTYRNILTRCYNKNNPKYRRYGARGIFVCEQWLGINGFNNFLKDVGERPNKNLTIDRINNDGPYSKENCRWATAEQQQNNKTHSPATNGSPNRKAVLCIENNKIYPSIASAALELNLSDSKISLVCRGHSKKTKGYSFKYA